MESHEELKQEVSKLTWAHRIDLGNNIVTPGAWPPSPLISRVFSDVDFRGKKVLDVGCWDGLWSFEAEKRGAKEIYATDYVSQRWGGTETFLLARKALGSKAHYYPDLSVYSIGSLGVRDFDIVIFCGVYYHLKDPLLAFARLREVMRDKGILIVEGVIIHEVEESYARFLYRGHYKQDATNWWVPTIACLREWIECSFFDIVREYGELEERPTTNVLSSLRRRLRSRLKDVRRYVVNARREETTARYALTARAVCRKDPNYWVPDEELRRFDLNEYPRRSERNG